MKIRELMLASFERCNPGKTLTPEELDTLVHAVTIGCPCGLQDARQPIQNYTPTYPTRLKWKKAMTSFLEAQRTPFANDPS